MTDLVADCILMLSWAAARPKRIKHGTFLFSAGNEERDQKMTKLKKVQGNGDKNQKRGRKRTGGLCSDEWLRESRTAVEAAHL